jgi:hypothetical protein
LEIISYLFLHRAFTPAKVLPSGFDTFDFYFRRFREDHIYRVDYIPGGIASFSKQVIEEFPFSSEFQDAYGYGQGQDREYGYRVSRKYHIYVNPRAKVYHFQGKKVGKHDKRRKGREFVLSRYYFFKTYLAQEKHRLPLFYYSLGGYLITRILSALFSLDKEELERVKGVVDAIKLILTKEIKGLGTEL